MADIAIMLAIAAGAFAGWRMGFVVPLLIQAGALLSLGALYAGPFTGVVPSGGAGLGMGLGVLVIGSSLLGAVGRLVMGVIYRFGVLARFDKVAGIPLGAATAAVTLYVALIGVIALDGWLEPLHNKTAIGAADLTAVGKLAALNPALGAFADPTTLQELALTAAKVPIASDQLTKYNAALGIYEQSIRPAILSSKIAPLLLSLGEQLPLIGRHVEMPHR